MAGAPTRHGDCFVESTGSGAGRSDATETMQHEAGFPPHDPLGYYAILGVGPLADRTEIKAAYRRLVKRLHPDYNPMDEAEEAFLKVNEAYQVLCDRRRRAAYDAALRPSAPLPPIDPSDPAPRPLACSCCGRVSAQPRYIVFHWVKSCLARTRHDTIRGIFCRECADRAAIRASTVSWLWGWWAPAGPWHTVRALWRNLKGGDKPRADNLRLLLHQARAFFAEGSPEIAAALARQAERFATSDKDRARITRLLDDVETRTRRLKSRWGVWSHATLVQALPLSALALALGLGAATWILKDRTDSAAAEIVVAPAQAGEIRHVAVDMLKMRQGPAADQPVVALLDRFTTVQVVDSTPDGQWARVLIPTGATGYVPSRYLFGGAGIASRDRWCADHRGAPPANGEVLMRLTGGAHVLSVANATGHDIVVRLKTPDGPTLMAFFVAAGAKAAIDGVPDGSFHAEFALGRDFSRACGVFLDAMKTFQVPEHPIATPAQTASLVVPPIGDKPDMSHPLAIERYLDH